MKIERIHIENFKRFKTLDLSFKNSAIDEISDRFLVLGDNGSGKTTLLQAIALPLAIATRHPRVNTSGTFWFDWTGFVPARYGRPRIELVVTFEESELKATQEIARLWYEQFGDSTHPFIEPGNSRQVTLTLDGLKATASTASEYYQFWGRYYLRQLIKTDNRLIGRFLELPGVFWFDQFRYFGSLTEVKLDEEAHPKRLYELLPSQLRDELNKWKQLKKLRYSPLDRLEQLYRTIFLDRSFSAETEPILNDAGEIEDVYFMLSDGKNTYDLEEMSGGEQALFPIFYQFVKQNIAHSVVLIDEIDLNLHPPLAQQLVTQLYHLAPNCQYIFTTHSSVVSESVDSDEIHRFQEGSLCL
ncbi:MAG: AAA family ATPase [Anaerolineae bacterium]|nr:AAA family ATPase [Anaerolineae bacterium]